MAVFFILSVHWSKGGVMDLASRVGYVYTLNIMIVPYIAELQI